ncbi:MAG: AbrB/MazE/SpoVT family DNA-binding domain-containing protein [Chloroflexota bacterium]|nr:AbrB/MazE/SpoVT family DNA-binding domain-containing protein [Chloroflexota bacterium]
MSTVTSKGQVTLPKKVRDGLGLVPGSEVEFELREGEVLLRKSVSEEKFARWQGYLRGKLSEDSVDQFVDTLRGEEPAGTAGS